MRTARTKISVLLSAMADIGLDLNQTITHAVQARIEAEVAKAFVSDEFLASYITAALQQQIEVKVGDYSYDRKKVSFLHHTLSEAIRMATKTAVAKWLAANSEQLEAEVEKALRRETKSIASALAQSLLNAADKTYGVDVKIDLKMPRSDG